MEKIMSKLASFFVAVFLMSVSAVATPRPHIPAKMFPTKGRPVQSWMKSTVAQTENPLVYVSVLTGLTTGVTDVYEIANGSATLVGQLNVGGGGAVAVDAEENVYIINADYDDNLYQQNSPVSVFARGSTDPFFTFQANGFAAEAMTVGPDGTVYMTGQMYPNTSTFGGMKFAAGSATRVALPTDTQSPIYPTGLALDASGNLFAGWYGAALDPCGSGCVEELVAGQKKWKNSVPDLAANALAAGPFELSNGSQVLWTGVAGRFNYIETLKAKRKNPSQVLPLPPALFTNGPLAASLSADGGDIWATETGLEAPPGSTIYEVDYPSGNLSTSFPVNDPDEFFLIIGMAASPTYYPAQ
jgi:hypothetical protein